MIRAFKMKLFDGMAQEYERRHNELWPEMKQKLKEHGASNYSIFLDAETNYLFSYVELSDDKLWDSLSNTDICKKWWEYMKDIMETNPDNSPVSVPLRKVFHLD